MKIAFIMKDLYIEDNNSVKPIILYNDKMFYSESFTFINILYHKIIKKYICVCYPN